MLTVKKFKNSYLTTDFLSKTKVFNRFSRNSIVKMSSTQEPSQQEQETTELIKNKRKSYSVNFKIEAIKFADETSNKELPNLTESMSQ
jgi:hypothetical protein